MTHEEKLRKYANACVTVGINLKKGQPLYISSPIECAPFTRLVVEEAYKNGASDVNVMYKDEQLTKLKFDLAPEESLLHIPNWALDIRMEEADRDCAFMHIVAEDPLLLKDCDPIRVAKYSKASSAKLKPYSERSMKNEIQWLVVAHPSKSSADKVFPNNENSIELLWEQIFNAVRIDDNDPKDNWDKHIKNLKDKVDFLNENKFDHILIKSSNGTDLKVGLAKNNVFEGGGGLTTKGHFFLPNMPTEEVFGMPHKDLVDGVVKSTKPLNFRGVLINDFSLTFKNGEVVDYSAKEGYETLKGLLETDRGARSLGEIAFVPYDSPISNSNLIFYNTLFDENASCHLALGRAYPTNMLNGDKLSREELTNNGANDSLIHEDFMIGDKDTEIIGVKLDGTQIKIFENGNYAI